MTIIKSISQNRGVFGRLVVGAQSAAATGKDELAAAVVALAAHFAWNNHPGVFMSPELELVLSQIALPASTSLSSARPGVSRVVHVVTELGAIGGHTRLLARWLEQDTTRRHEVVVTGGSAARERTRDTRRTIEVPDVVELSGGLLERAAALRRHAAGADLVVLHVHPFDVVPSLAFVRDPFRPPVALVNHADHVFWVGVGVSDVVICLRRSGERLAQAQRGVPASRTCLLPVPVTIPDRATDRTRLPRAPLGLSDDGVLLVSVASAYKFGRRGRRFLRVARRLLSSVDSLSIVVVGPDARAPWKRLARKFPGRFQAAGRRPDLDPILGAADLYLDSYPVPSITSLVDAGAYSLPVVSLVDRLDPPGVFTSDDPRLEGLRYEAKSVDELVDWTHRLAVEPESRRTLGRQVAHALVSDAAHDEWRRGLDEVWVRALAIRSQGSLVHEVGPTHELDGLDGTRRLVLRWHPGSDLRASYLEHHADSFPTAISEALSASERTLRVLARWRAPMLLRNALFLRRVNAASPGP